METLQQIIITETKESKYQTTITLGKMGDGMKYCVIISTNRTGIVNYFEDVYDTYKEALSNYLDDVQEYAYHTALMNL